MKKQVWKEFIELGEELLPKLEGEEREMCEFFVERAKEKLKHTCVKYCVFYSEKDIGLDPLRYEIEIDGEIVKTYGDDYHDDGGAKADGFVEGYAQAKGWKNYLYTFESKIDKTVIHEMT